MNQKLGELTSLIIRTPAEKNLLEGTDPKVT
jgi:hypothetical protein